MCVREVEKLSFYGSEEHNRKRPGVVVWSPVPDSSDRPGPGPHFYELRVNALVM